MFHGLKGWSLVVVMAAALAACGGPAAAPDAGTGGGGGGGGAPRPPAPVSRLVLAEIPISEDTVRAMWVDEQGALFSTYAGEVFSVPLAGGATTSLFTFQNVASVAATSSQIVFAGGYTDGGIFIRPRAGGLTTRVYQSDFASFYLQAGDDEVFALVNGDLNAVSDGGLELVASNVYTRQIEVRGGSAYYASFGDLRVAPRDGGAASTVVDPPGFGSLRAFSFGGDGRLYFSSQRYGGQDAGDIDELYVMVDAGEFQPLLSQPAPAAYGDGDHWVAEADGRVYWLRQVANYQDHYHSVLQVLDRDGGVHSLSGTYEPLLMKRTSRGVVIGSRGQASCFSFPCDESREPAQIALIQVATPDGG